jgi:hypothetical protein
VFRDPNVDAMNALGGRVLHAEPVPPDGGWLEGVGEGICPVCQNAEVTAHCRNCGQQLDWAARFAEDLAREEIDFDEPAPEPAPDPKIAAMNMLGGAIPQPVPLAPEPLHAPSGVKADGAWTSRAVTCPTCLRVTGAWRALERCPGCGQLLDWSSDFADRHRGDV